MFKTIFIVVIITALVVIAYFSFTNLIGSNLSASHTINAVPDNAALFIECNNLPDFVNELKTDNQIWNELENIPEINKSLCKSIELLDSTFISNKGINSLLKDKSSIISAHVIGKNKVKFLYLISLENSNNINSANKYLKSILTNDYKINERTYGKVDIYDATPTNNNRNSFSYTFSNGIFIMSQSPILVEEAITQLNSERSILNNKDFREVLNTAGKKVHANVYINFKLFPKLISTFLANPYKKFVLKNDNLANWSEIDLKLKNRSLLMYGYTQISDSANNYLNVFKDQSPVKFEMHEVLPANTSTFLALGINNYPRFLRRYKEYLKKSDNIDEYNKNISNIKQQTNIDAEELLATIIDNEIGLVYTDLSSKDIESDKFIVIKTKSHRQAEEELVKLIIGFTENNAKKLSSYTNSYKIDDEISFPIYQLPINDLISNLFGEVFKREGDEYFSFVDNYLIIGNSVKSLSKFIHKNVLEKTLTSDINYNEFSDNISSDMNIYLYSNIARSPDLYKRFTNKNISTAIDSNLTTLRKFQAIAVQINATGNMLYNNIYFEYNPVFKEAPRTVWESHLDTTFNFKPKLVVNHNNNQKEIFVQDVNNTIYLINNSGRIIWKIPVKGEITSDVTQIDYYNNGKLQYLFSTKTNIYIIDRLGNNVEQFPLKLRAQATNGVSVFDYENNKNYRFFIACKDKRVYCYDKEGKILKGWEFDKTEGSVTNEIQHFKSDGKDYILFSDNIYSYILDRRGNTRIDIKDQSPTSANNIFHMETISGDKKLRFVTTDTVGNIVNIYLDGSIESKKIEEFSSSHYFDYKDVNGDNEKDYIFLDKESLKVFDQKKNTIFTYEFDEEITSPPTYYLFPGYIRKIGVVSEKTNEIFLLNSNGDLYEDFPLYGKTQFSIGNMKSTNSKFNLFVGSGDNFLYNYKVH